MTDHDWPGNVRELSNVVERAMITSDGAVLRVADQFDTLSEEANQGNRTLEEMEKEYITRVLNKAHWRIEGPKGAARILGLNPSTLRSRISKLGIQKDDNSTVISAG